jgi:hypothetical protein
MRESQILVASMRLNADTIRCSGFLSLSTMMIARLPRLKNTGQNSAICFNTKPNLDKPKCRLDYLSLAFLMTDLVSYVNFATGDETEQGMYGDEWRLKKLRDLKAKWDPSGHFSHYNPIK